MKIRDALTLATAAWLASAACSSPASRPPELGDCIGDDASCSPGNATGAGGPAGSGGDAGPTAPAGACAVGAGASQCDQCAARSCCAQLDACDALQACGQLSSCIYNCPSSACVAACKQQFAAGQGPYDALLACLSPQCPICEQSGVGDPCSLPCVLGLSCGGLWCTKPCLSASDCAGIGAGDRNVVGQVNQCVRSPSGANECAPGCTIDADCIDFPGTYCRSVLAPNGQFVQVCGTPPPDAGP